jgi:hypothetical protein
MLIVVVVVREVNRRHGIQKINQKKPQHNLGHGVYKQKTNRDTTQ